MARRVVRELGLADEPEFNPTLRPPTMMSKFRDWATGLLQYLGAAPDLESMSEAESERRRMVTVVDAFREGLTVKPRRQSRVIQIAFESENPMRAVEVANKMADMYLVGQLEAKFDATRRATAWLSSRIVGLKRKLETSERAVEAFRKRAGLIQGGRRCSRRYSR